MNENISENIRKVIQIRAEYKASTEIGNIYECDPKFIPWINEAYACPFPGVRTALCNADMLTGAYDVTPVGKKAYEEYLILYEYYFNVLVAQEMDK
jgi:hypothetical protein